MRVLFDYQTFLIQTHGGISRYFAELSKHFPDDIHTKFALKETDNVYLREMGIGKSIGGECYDWLMPGYWPLKGRLFNLYNIFCGFGNDYLISPKLFNKTFSINTIKRGEFDIFHPTFYDDYFLPYLKGKPFVLTIHDMITERFPNYFGTNDNQSIGKKSLAPKAAAILAVSENTKKDIIEILHVPEEKVHVVYHGCSFPDCKHLIRLVDREYILYVGGRDLYKNFSTFVETIVPVLKNHPELYVVCTGNPFNVNQENQMCALGVKDRFIHYWVNDDEEFFSLYHFARCFVFPSEYEGFGIPILEAYKADCPVLLNDTSCMPEVAGDAAIYFQMKSGQSNLATVLEDFLHKDITDVERIKIKQRERLKLYSWERAANQVADIYRSILDH